MKTVISINKSQVNETAKYRLKVLKHFWGFGLKSTLSAFPVARPTVFRWQQQLKKNHGKLDLLIPQSTKPNRVRQTQVSLAVVAKIKELRLEWPNLSKHKLKPLIDAFCVTEHYQTISTTTIGKIIKRHNYFFTRENKICHDPDRKRMVFKTKNRVWKAPKQTIGYVEADLVETQVDGKKIFTVCWIDIGSKVAFSKTYSRKTSRNILASFLAYEQFHPGKIHTFQTDNGSEFEGALDIFLRTKRPEIVRKYTPVRSPKINGVIERYNRSLQDDWLNHHLDLFHDPENWNKALAKYVHFYNFQRVHETLQYKTPMQYLGIQKSLICP